MTPVITYIYRGQVEWGTGEPGYQWHPGYSEGDGKSVSYPWMTRAECRADAASRGARARFDERVVQTHNETCADGLTFDGEASFADERK